MSSTFSVYSSRLVYTSYASSISGEPSSSLSSRLSPCVNVTKLRPSPLSFGAEKKKRSASVWQSGLTGEPTGLAFSKSVAVTVKCCCCCDGDPSVADAESDTLSMGGDNGVDASMLCGTTCGSSSTSTAWKVCWPSLYPTRKRTRPPTGRVRKPCMCM